jgi:hypothetical protein
MITSYLSTLFLTATIFASDSPSGFPDPPVQKAGTAIISPQLAPM